MYDDLLYTGAAIGGLIVLSAFFSGSETGLTGVSRAVIHRLKMEGHSRAKMVDKLHENKDRLIAAILLGNNIVNILASALATALAIRYYGDDGVVYATIVMTVLVLIFAEVLPKTYAFRNTEKVALFVAPIVTVMVKLLSPVTVTVEIIVDRVLRLFGVKESRSGVRELMAASEALRGAIEMHHSEGAVVKDERDMLGGILDLSAMKVEDVMVHRKNMVSVQVDLDPQLMSLQISKNPFTRVPVWKDNPENIIGVLHVKTYLVALQAAQGDVKAVDAKSLITKPWFVPASTTLKKQLKAFLRKRQHVAFVVDEYGALLGMVTLEDILEEIVGQIEDEHDSISHQYKLTKEKDESGSCTVDGTMPIRDLNREMDWNIPDEEASTIAGLIIYEAERIPDNGQVFQFHGYRFEVVKKKRHQVTRVKVSRLLNEGEDT